MSAMSRRRGPKNLQKSIKQHQKLMKNQSRKRAYIFDRKNIKKVSQQGPQGDLKSIKNQSKMRLKPPAGTLGALRSPFGSILMIFIDLGVPIFDDFQRFSISFSIDF